MAANDVSTLSRECCTCVALPVALAAVSWWKPKATRNVRQSCGIMVDEGFVDDMARSDTLAQRSG